MKTSELFLCSKSTLSYILMNVADIYIYFLWQLVNTLTRKNTVGWWEFTGYMKKLVTRWRDILMRNVSFRRSFTTRCIDLVKNGSRGVKRKLPTEFKCVSFPQFQHTHTHTLKFAAAAFIMPIDFNYCPSDLAQRACFQAAEPEKSSFAAKPWKSWPHSSILGEKPVPFFVFLFFVF